MASKPSTASLDRDEKVDEGQVACSPTQWAQMVLQSQSIAVKDPKKNNKVWDFGIKENAFASGSEMKQVDYLRLRVLWYTWTDQYTFRSYMRNNPALLNDNQQSTPYTGYITPENDHIADVIYNAIKPKLEGYLCDILRVKNGQGDATRPSGDCDMFYMARYWQGLVALKLKEVYDDDDQKKYFRGKVRKSEIGTARAPGPSLPPQTPRTQTQPRQPQDGFGTPALDPARASAGGLQNPATADETYVNTALLLLLQTVTRLMTDLQESDRSRSRSRGRPTTTGNSPPKTPSRIPSETPSNSSRGRPNTTGNSLPKTPSRNPSKTPSNSSPGPAARRPPGRKADAVSSQPTTTVAIRPASKPAGQDHTRPSSSHSNPRSHSAARVTRQTDPSPAGEPHATAPGSTDTKGQDDDKGESPDPLAEALSRISGLRHLDWLADRLALNLLDRSSKTTSPRKLMEARVDGYLCRRDFVVDPGRDGQLAPRFNQYPLAIIEAKPFTRLSALSSIRWQESAEIASWVSGLDEAYEDVGLLQSSTSGRKRRLLISQDRHELWIIIAEYGDEWKHYIRGNKLVKPPGFNQSQDVKDLAGSEGFVSLAQEADPGRFDDMMAKAEEARGARPRSTRASRGPSLELPGPEYFCIMQQWGPYKTEDAAAMDNFIRRLIGLQVQLLSKWPSSRFQNPSPHR
ncbi:hypothetical protein KVR01_003316 [Diaporthe batatas]|uniref:uncharacterized protein n=1 Tax=Diaporthe batatas TaxID=748121 RepID=UPI001D04C0BE|nr:uncharacterized protein KVR01_003316 [Diaporthe batatas]KAG8167627.1 hypothetical protein KVR01_003316 [Diaporthe batatas]